jgi:hypothetical protein
MSLGSRQTRKKRRVRRRRAKLRESANAVLRESAHTGRNVLRKSASYVLNTLLAIAYVSARAVSKLADIVLRELLRAGRNLLIAAAHASASGVAGDSILFVALLGSSAAVVASVFVGKIELAILFCLLTLVLCATLWVKGYREPLEGQRRSSNTGVARPNVRNRVER